ncbi:unnamed protein product (macronuclear) [Paramecium tetraurelia]|uniref:Uncharacterized protein n=1 Tax=Paramecium tetraurelia TaxID=5888 RepID=A0C1U1_PARTE|nr:uncharacterized protein GSPATT00034235001 [Paramecium tetraurelia]CAK64758.1 unnamed protein product [Paramecium tetraurelia]|eukprot:XP_001432155.1 hypothetical protein (macronuclear) [Paramecium tetraurelia strain d4-2]
MNSIGEFAMKCSKENHDYASLTCLNKTCESSRIYCDQCLRNGDHIDHINDQWNLSRLIQVFKSIEKKSKTLISDLCLMNEVINQLFTKLNQKIRKKFQYSQERIQGQDTKQLNQILDEIIKYDEFQKELLEELHHYSDNMIMYLTRQITELKLDKLSDYQLDLQDIEEVESLHESGYQLYYKDNKCKAAIKIIDDALLINPKHLNSLRTKGIKSDINVLAYCLQRLGNYHDAIVFAEKALLIESKHVKSLFIKAECLRMLGRFNDAIIWIDKALSIDSKNINSLYTKAECLFMIDNYKEAILWADKTLSIDSKHLNCLFTKAYSLYMIDNYNEAILRADKALSIDPKHVNSLFTKSIKQNKNLAECLQRLGNYNDAIFWADKTLLIDSKHVNSLFTKGISSGNMES